MAPTDPYDISRLIDSLRHQNNDGISSSLIKNIKHAICFPLTILINTSISPGKVSELLKTATIIPIYKAKDKKKQLNDYRPISLLPTKSKILEKSINKRL